ncbi:MAG: hypothetical protein ONB48_03815 [candidate division KSB1 bacterium]|nr:hypothetical protein [candidate division KSB1 bacterium]MDZ7274562.1 hypothetical protein [candidate division KSB1 bacterium]MDZ7284777.1 hypothetical protein [candidate division KSB1 bacterium]MDZ7297803.1 hypothetical protein [candidate division KSB1 bacterium]MDZ7306408.1 hypothetical protein [candidate division KSB1 bacterium]
MVLWPKAESAKKQSAQPDTKLTKHLKGIYALEVEWPGGIGNGDLPSQIGIILFMPDQDCALGAGKGHQPGIGVVAVSKIRFRLCSKLGLALRSLHDLTVDDQHIVTIGGVKPLLKLIISPSCQFVPAAI